MESVTQSIILPTSVDQLREALLPDFQRIVAEEVRKLDTSKDVYVKTIEELSQFLTNGSDKSYSRSVVVELLKDPEISKGCIGESKNEQARIYNATKIRSNLVKAYDKRYFRAR
ncbi:MAG: hypothetical protein Q4D23_11950 [Bacteroidales bacterium]|nr:hypothetical protein [Bacteroidales bacterium]